MSPGIYYLIARNIKTNEKVQIELTNKSENRYCTVLSYIDSLTTKFINKEQLIKRLFDNGYINFMDADIYIEYNHNGLKFEEVVYKDMEKILNMPMVSDSIYDISDKVFDDAAEKYIEALGKRNINKHALVSPKLNLKFKEHIKKYVDEIYKDFNNFNKNKLKQDLTSYKTFRDLYFVINEAVKKIDQKELDELTQKRLSAKLLDFKPIKKGEPKQEEKQLEFDIYKNEVSVPNPNQVVTQEELEKTIKEHNEEREEFLTEDDWNQNYYPYNIKKK